jgi:hypothetical protein
MSCLGNLARGQPKSRCQAPHLHRRSSASRHVRPDIPWSFSIGHWEGDTLVVDTVDILPQAPLAISEAVGVPNDGDMRVTERIYLAEKDILHVELEITAPNILTKPWKTTRIFFRQRARKFDIVEGRMPAGRLQGSERRERPSRACGRYRIGMGASFHQHVRSFHDHDDQR